MLEYWNDGLWNYRENDRHWKPNSLNTYKMVRSFFSAVGGPSFQISNIPVKKYASMYLLFYVLS